MRAPTLFDDDPAAPGLVLPGPDRGGSLPERGAAAADAAETLAEALAGGPVPWERACARLVLCLYPLTRPEFERVARLVIELLLARPGR